MKVLGFMLAFVILLSILDKFYPAFALLVLLIGLVYAINDSVN